VFEAFSFTPGDARNISKVGTWFQDESKRFVLFRGVNFSSRSKAPPYLPVMPLDIVTDVTSDIIMDELNTVKNDLDLMKELGFNIVRLPIMWKALEPTPNPNLDNLLPEGKRYLTLITSVIKALSSRGLFVLIDYHQDIAHEVYGGDGFPDWTLAIDDNHERPQQAKFKDTTWWLHYYQTPLKRHDKLVRHTIESFWRDNLFSTELTQEELETMTAKFPRTHMERTIGSTARFFQNHEVRSAILGYEPFNEPHPVGIDKPEFEGQVLPLFYSNVSRAIRSSLNGIIGDDKAFIFIEPRMDWNTYATEGPEFDGLNFTLIPSTLLDTSNVVTERAVFSFHYYDPWTLFWASSHLADNMNKKQQEWPNEFRMMIEAATCRNLIPFLTEFGGSQDWEFDTDLNPVIYQNKQIRAYMDLQFRQIESNLLNATYWNYNLYNTIDGKDNWNLENFSLLGPDRKARHLDIVARPYPMRSSARSSLLFFDLESKHCCIILEGEVVESPTVIYVPHQINYPTGFEIRATNKTVQWDHKNQLLFWVPDKQETTNQIIIFPPDSFDENKLPQESKNLLPKTPAIGRVLGDVIIAFIQYNLECTDVEGEYVIIQINGPIPVDMTSWSLQDKANHIFYFPQGFVLASGVEVRIWTKSGKNDANNLYSEQPASVWNNSGDVAVLLDVQEIGICSYSYNSKIPVTHADNSV
jgi:aryl-phospho-beta-D-glucosidase BglC (GH1 family)